MSIKNPVNYGKKSIKIQSYYFSTNFPSDRYRSYEESLRNVSLILINSHFISDVVRPLLPNLVEVGGLQVKPKTDALPEVRDMK